jgi:hypothetical protein
MTQTLEVPEVPEALLQAAAAHGPGDTTPPHVRTPFPTLALPPVLRRFVEEKAEALGVPRECVATPALAACATAIGNTIRIRLNAEWTEPAVLWAVVLMESGSLKTPAYNAAMEPLVAAQKLYEQEFARAKDAYRQAKADYEVGNSLWNRQAEAPPPTPPTTPEEPVEPTPKDLFASDSTVEALAILFQNNPRGLAFTRDELSGFFGSFGAYKGGRGADEAAYLEFYNAGISKINRASGKRLFAGSAALSIFGTCQPTVFLKVIGAHGKGSNQVENGLASRFILAAPARMRKRWRAPRPVKSSGYWKMADGLLGIDLPKNAQGMFEPAVIALLPEAEARFGAFVNEHGDHTFSIENPALRYHYSKLEAIAGRLALILYLCEWASGGAVRPQGVEDRHVLAGIALARWYGREAQRVYGGYESEEEREMRELVEKIRDRGGVVSPRDMRGMSRKYRDADAAETALKALESHGLGAFIWDNAGPQGGRPSKLFRLQEDPAYPETVDSEVPAGDTGYGL